MFVDETRMTEGEEMRFIPKSLLIYKANTTTGNYHGQKNSKFLEKWASEKLIPNSRKNCVAVIGNAAMFN